MPFTANPIQLGKSDPQFLSYERPGSYALIVNEKQQLAVLKSKGGTYFLPGGGIEKGESKEDALIREVIEEAGLLVRIKEEFYNINEWFWVESSNQNMNKQAYFFLAQIEGEVPNGKIEDYELLWLSLLDASHVMGFGCELRALEKLTATLQN